MRYLVKPIVVVGLEFFRILPVRDPIGFKSETRRIR